ncbi:hypothetical protein Tco_1231244 [Tanacetum coccineum]
MVNNSSSASASASLAVAAAALLISFVCPPEIVNVGLVFLDDVILNHLPFSICVATTKELVIKEKIFLCTLEKQKIDCTFRIEWPKSVCFNKGQASGVTVEDVLHNAFNIHPEGNSNLWPTCSSFHGRDSSTDLKISMTRLPYAECVGVLEFVMTGPTGCYDELMNEVYKALEFSGFQSSLKLEYSQISKAEAMKEIERRFHLKKKVIDSTFTNALRNKVGITEWPWIRHTHSRASSSASETQSNPTRLVKVAEMSCEQTPTMEPSALGLPEQHLLAVVRELDEMEEDQDDMEFIGSGKIQ